MKTNPDNEKPDAPIMLSEFAEFTSEVFRKMDQRDRAFLDAVKEMLNNSVAEYARRTERDDRQDRRLDRLEKKAGLDPIEG